MKKALVNTRVSVKLRKSEYREEWYLYVEAYPVFKQTSPPLKECVNIWTAPLPLPFGISPKMPEQTKRQDHL